MINVLYRRATENDQAGCALAFLGISFGILGVPFLGTVAIIGVLT